MYLPYGVNERGELVYIDQVTRGRTTLHCPYCAVPLIARKGTRITPHFAHDGPTCRSVKRSAATITLPVYDSFRLYLSGSMWETLCQFHEEKKQFLGSWLEDAGLVKSFYTPYGNLRYELTHKGKVPFGELSLNLFNQFQEPLILEQHAHLENKVLATLDTPDAPTALTDLRLYRAQMRRILEVMLYFIEVRTPEQVLHKIGVTSRLLEQRLSEIKADLRPHFGTVELIPLGTWAHRGNVEPYFKHRYRAFQHPIGTLTEYFAFSDVKAVLRDLRRMKPKVLSAVEQEILAGKASCLEQGGLPERHALSAPAWFLLQNFTPEAATKYHRARLELYGYKLGGRERALVDHQRHPATGFMITPYGELYREKYAHFYHQRYGRETTGEAMEQFA